jgi:hypothetical protein
MWPDTSSGCDRQGAGSAADVQGRLSRFDTSQRQQALTEGALSARQQQPRQ